MGHGVLKHFIQPGFYPDKDSMIIAKKIILGWWLQVDISDRLSGEW
jgi:hypothetical protein